LDEAAEQVLANVSYWKNTYGEELQYYQLGNEQQSGNQASKNPDADGFGKVNATQQIVDLVKRAGARLRASGFSRTRFVVGTEETEEWSYFVADAIMADKKAAQYVGAIAYHSYPYHRGYSSVPFILSTSGAGKPDAGRIGIRHRIRDLAKAHKVGAWITENSNAGSSFSYDTFRARAIQIHDEFLYANVSAYFGESAIWDEVSQQKHFGTTDLDDSEGNVVLVHNASGTVDISGIGYAIGHYARWAKPGSVRVEAQSSERLVEVTAFRDDAEGRLVLVLINNADEPEAVTVSIKGVDLTGTWEGEQSTPADYWSPIPSFASDDAAILHISLPATSVASLAGKVTN
jgi:O-glycosyl hydrolase